MICMTRLIHVHHQQNIISRLIMYTHRQCYLYSCTPRNSSVSTDNQHCLATHIDICILTYTLQYEIHYYVNVIHDEPDFCLEGYLMLQEELDSHIIICMYNISTHTLWIFFCIQRKQNDISGNLYLSCVTNISMFRAFSLTTHAPFHSYCTALLNDMPGVTCRYILMIMCSYSTTHTQRRYDSVMSST